MIISHQHKCIFIKPTKVAGTSMEINLAKHCGPDDIITSVNDFSPESDEDSYEDLSRNDTGYYNHIKPEQIRERIGADVFDSYYTFTIVRNPWDLVVSRYWWEKARAKKALASYLTPGRVLRNLVNPSAYKSFFSKARKKQLAKVSEGSFEDFVANYNPAWKNTDYYLTTNDKPWCDFYIKYEDLDGGYKQACEKIGIPYEQLPRTKTKQRKERKPYTEYYNQITQQQVADLFADEIAYFNHQFEN